MSPQRKRRIKGSSGTTFSAADERAISAILAERARFHRFIAARVGDEATAEDLLQESLWRALKESRSLHRSDSAVPWFYRILRNAISDHFRKTGAESRRASTLLADLEARGDDVSTPPADWDAAVCACFRGLLPALKPRYAEVIRRIDLQGESKADVARDLEVNSATMDVLLHRARQALRRRLEVFCGACSREHCLACLCKKDTQRLEK